MWVPSSTSVSRFQNEYEQYEEAKVEFYQYHEACLIVQQEDNILEKAKEYEDGVEEYRIVNEYEDYETYRKRILSEMEEEIERVDNLVDEDREMREEEEAHMSTLHDYERHITSEHYLENNFCDYVLDNIAQEYERMETLRAEEVMEKDEIIYKKKKNRKDWEYPFLTEERIDFDYNFDVPNLCRQNESNHFFVFSPPELQFFGNLQSLCEQAIARNLHLYDYQNMKIFSKALDITVWNRIMKLAVSYPTVNAAIIVMWCKLTENEPCNLNLKRVNISLNFPNEVLNYNSFDSKYISPSLLSYFCRTPLYTITEINLSGSVHSSISFLAIPRYLPFIKVIKCKNTKLNNEVIKEIADHCHNLEHLDIRKTEVRCHYFSIPGHFCDFEKLTSQCFRLNALLTDVKCGQTIFPKIYTKRNKNNPQRIMHLHLDYRLLLTPSFFDQCFIQLHLSHLTMHNFCNSDFRNSANLKHLKLISGRVDEFSLGILLSGNELQKLKLKNCTRLDSSQFYSLISPHVNLQSLDLDAVQDSTVSIAPYFLRLPEFPLTKLSLDFLHEDACRAMMTRVPHLRKLKLQAGPENISSVLAEAPFFRNLTSLKLFFSCGEELQKKIATECKNLDTLYLSYGGFSKKSLREIFINNPTIRNLSLFQPPLDDKLLYDLVSSHPNLRKLRFLATSKVEVSNFGFYLISRFCKLLRTLIVSVEPDNFSSYMLLMSCPHLSRFLKCTSSTLLETADNFKIERDFNLM